MGNGHRAPTGAFPATCILFYASSIFFIPFSSIFMPVPSLFYATSIHLFIPFPSPFYTSSVSFLKKQFPPIFNTISIPFLYHFHSFLMPFPSLFLPLPPLFPTSPLLFCTSSIPFPPVPRRGSSIACSHVKPHKNPCNHCTPRCSSSCRQQSCRGTHLFRAPPSKVHATTAPG